TAFLCAVIAGFMFWLGGMWAMLFAFLFLCLNALLDALDGKIAKMFGKASKRGDFLDHVLDRYADIFIVGGILLSGFYNFVLAFFALLGILLTSYMGTQAQAVGAGRDYGGIMGRADRLFVLMLLTLVQLIAFPFQFGGFYIYGLFISFIDIAMIIIAIGGNVTAVQRAVRTWKRI
ncbi:MAG: CDP-alcohol phosphatidyltransferase family protein, partial [Thermoplasmata archaeon]